MSLDHFLHAVHTAAHQLKQGNILAYPTEAVWGLGCDPYQQDAFARLLTLKQRPIEKGVILLASDVQQIAFLLDLLTPAQRQTVIHSWTTAQTQATTWLFPYHDRIPSWIVGQHEQVAVRVTQHHLCQALCRAFGGFIVSTSANPAGLPPAQNYAESHAYFAQHVHYLHGDTLHA
ncbi:MAG: Sua5/YciO/YrdC/YwlC family protein, partial [Acinetobacter sp.]|nr:Sua5/YciO/YrdC/YwlC family protein [Acinetobacter sp.]